jgi:hypothetical protein
LRAASESDAELENSAEQRVALWHLNPELPADHGILELPGHLTEMQCVYFRAQQCYNSYEEVIDKFLYVTEDAPEEPRRLSRQALQNCLKRTALGQRWFPGCKGGSDCYLCKDDVATFKEALREKAGQLNSVITPNAIALARALREARYRSAIHLLTAVNARGLARQLQDQVIEPPDRSWLNHVAGRMGIGIRNPETIDEARARHCNTTTIRIFFERFRSVMDRPECLILNCDETHVSARKNFKVVTPDGVAPLKRVSPKLPHFSAMCTISASGHAFEPTFILPDTHNLPSDLEGFKDRAYFLSTRNGWMTQVAFLFYCHILLHQLYIYRQTLPIHLRRARFLLILDGHISRFTYDALNLLYESGLDVLVFPAHCTHLLQPFDVSLGGALKEFLKRFCELWKITRDELDTLDVIESEPRWVAERRRSLIGAFLKAWSSAATLVNILSGFEAAGISPLNPATALKNRYASEPIDGYSQYPGDPDDPAEMNCALVTSPHILTYLKGRDNRIIPSYTGGAEIPDPVQQYCRLLAINDPDGTWLGGPSGHLWDIGIERYRLPEPREAQRWLFGICSTATTDCVWPARTCLEVELPTLIICRNREEVVGYTIWFNDQGQDHIVFCAESGEETNGTDDTGTVDPVIGERPPSQEPPGTDRRNHRRAARVRPLLAPECEPWLRFQDGESEVCVTTGPSVSGYHSVRRLQLVYTWCPSPTLFAQTNMESNNILICVSNRERGRLLRLPGRFDSYDSISSQ